MAFGEADALFVGEEFGVEVGGRGEVEGALRRIWRAVDLRRSRPRTTSVMFMAASSTTQASW